MNRITGRIASAVLVAALGASADAGAVVVGNVGVFSEYLFRGAVAENGAAVQGGIDWYADNGLFLGTWASNAKVVGGTEVDVYGGYHYKVNEKLSFDVGGWYYVFPEDEEIDDVDLDGDGQSDDTDFDFGEVFAFATYAWFKFTAFYASSYAKTGDEGVYVSGILTVPIDKTLNVAVQVGHTSGDGAREYFGDTYTDWSVTVNKTVREGLTFSLSAVDTDLKDTSVLFHHAEDKPKVVVGLKYVFDF